MRKYLLLLPALPLLVSCASTQVTLNARGTMAMISLTNGAPRRAELLALQNRTLIVLTDSVWVIPESEIRSVDLDIDQERGPWITLTLLTQVAPTVAFLMSDKTENHHIGLVGVAVTAGTVASFLLSEPKEKYDWPPTPEQTETFRTYLCYPYGITPGQLQILKGTFRGWH
jgi:hypothetical protein